MISSPINSWQIEGEAMETVTVFIFLASKFTTNGDCSHKIKRHLLLGTKTMTNLDSILKSSNITLSTEVYLVKAMVFPVVMYSLSWTIKKAEVQRISILLNCGVGADSWESLELQVDQPANLKGNQSWIFTGRTDTETDAPIFWLPDTKNWLIGKYPDSGEN